MKGMYWLSALVLLCVSIVVTIPEAQAAATIYVDDDTCPSVGSGTSGDPYCAIQAALDAAIDGDVIEVAAGTYMENLLVPSSLQVTLNGAGRLTTIVDGNASGRVLEANPLSDVTISGMTFQNGLASQGAGLYIWGGLDISNCDIKSNVSNGSMGALYLYDLGTLTMTNCEVSGNTANQPGGSGGGMNIYGTAEVTDSQINNNQSDAEGGGIYVSNVGSLTLTNSTVNGNAVLADNSYGGGISSNGSLTASGVIVANNEILGAQTHGGGLYNSGTADISQSYFLSNESGWNGGGIHHSYGVLVLVDSVLRGNIAGSDGGGAFINDEVLFERVEISANSAAIGGGIKAQPGSGDDVNLLNVTISGNSATSGSGMLSTGTGVTGMVHMTIYANQITAGTNAGGLVAFNDVFIVNSVIAGNDHDECQVSSLISYGYNLGGDTSCGFLSVGDWQSIDPKLGPLAENGGFGKTHLPAADSVLIDHARPTDVYPQDQRGFPRPVDGDRNGESRSDIGAVELQLKSFLPIITR